jgi:Ca2+/Na+ antiporter
MIMLRLVLTFSFYSVVDQRFLCRNYKMIVAICSLVLLLILLAHLPCEHK